MSSLPRDERRQRFEQAVVPHLDAAYNLARWLTRNDHDAEDVVQDAFVRALRFFDGLRGDARPWLLAIVRNTAFTWLHANHPAEVAAGVDATDAADLSAGEDAGPEALASINLNRRTLNEAIAALPVAFREVLVLRELEELSYRDIARVIDAPVGTVMSRLSRARQLLQQSFHALLTASGARR